MENNQKSTTEIKPDLPAGKAGLQFSPQEDTTQPQVPQHSSKTLWYIGGGIIALFLIGGLFVVLQKSKTKSLPQQPVAQQPTLSPKPTLPRSKAPGIITNIATATSVDTKGSAVTTSSTFAKTDKNIYLVLTLNKPKIGTKIEYIRYLNGKYLDSGTNKILKPNVTNASFIWSLAKPGTMHLVGTYKVKIYINGIFEKETSYTVL